MESPSHSDDKDGEKPLDSYEAWFKKTQEEAHREVQNFVDKMAQTPAPDYAKYRTEARDIRIYNDDSDEWDTIKVGDVIKKLP